MSNGLHGNFRHFEAAIWNALASQLEGGGREWAGKKIVVRKEPFAITLDVHAEIAGHASRLVTRLRAGFVNADGFRFAVKRRAWWNDISKLFGEQDIEVGDAPFDDAFMIRASSEAKLKRLFGSAEVRTALLECPAMQRLEVRDHEGWFGPDFPEGVDELYLEAEGRITDIEHLHELYRVFAFVLAALCHIGSAYEDDPGLKL